MSRRRWISSVSIPLLAATLSLGFAALTLYGVPEIRRVSFEAGRQAGISEERERVKEKLEGIDKHTTNISKEVEELRYYWHEYEDRLVRNLPDYTLNTPAQKLSGLEQSLERAALQKITLVSRHVSAGMSIDSLFSNCVAIGSLTIPTLRPGQSWGKPGDRYYTTWHANGFFISDSGHVITSLHALKHFNDYNIIIVMDKDKNIHYAKLLAYSHKYDLALLKADAKNDLVPVTLLSDDALEKGRSVYRISVTPVGRPKYGFVPFGIENPEEITLERRKIGGHYDRKERLYVGDLESLLVEPLMINMPVKLSDSGSVVVDQNGYTVGISSAGNSEITMLSPASKIKGLVDFYLQNLQKP